MTTASKSYKRFQTLLYLIVGVLVFEGVTRKLIPSLGVVIFFLKDILCVVGLYLLADAKGRSRESPIEKQWKIVAILFLPLIVNSLFFDPLLVFFGTKQYLLFVVAAVIVPLGFPPDRIGDFKKFVAFVAFMIVPTSLVAILQNTLPPSHWINRSVAGESLEHFSAAGHLRVSSTFSFTGQYSFFLNMVTAFLAIRFFLPYIGKAKLLRRASGVTPIILSVLLLIGAFITGGRTAVLGCGAVVFIGFVLASIRSPKFFFGRGVLVFFILVAALVVVREIKPEFFEAYDQRSKGYGGMTQNEEVQERVLDSFLGWNKWFWDQDWRSIILGNGLGVMSNGSDQISTYAASIRAGGFWTESDFASSIWEGGVWLVVVWYGFRIAIIVTCLQVWRSLQSNRLVSSCAFLLGYVIIIGIIGTLGIQPPMALWWWLSVGAVMAIQGFDKYQSKI